MNFTNLFKIAVKALGNNKLRGFLTMLGIIIGVASVITMLAIGQGSKRSIQAEISEMGSNMIMIHPGGDMRGGVRLDADDMESLKLKDMEDIREKTRYVSYASPAVNSAGQAVYGANNTPTTVYGVNLDYLEIRPLQDRRRRCLLRAGGQDGRQGMSGRQDGRRRTLSRRREPRGACHSASARSPSGSSACSKARATTAWAWTRTT